MSKLSYFSNILNQAEPESQPEPEPELNSN